jgi:PAS domain S-box-containing protein
MPTMHDPNLTKKADSGTGVRGDLPRPADWMFLQPAILDHMHDAVLVTDLEGVITGCNQAAQRLFGYTAEAMIGLNLSILHAEEDGLAFDAQLMETVRENGEFQGEMRTRTNQGDYLYVHLSMALLRDGEEAAVGMVGFLVDVTAQKLAAIALKHGDSLEQKLAEEQASGEFLRMLARGVQRSNDVVMILIEDENHGQLGCRIVYVNPAFERQTGYAAEDVIGKSPEALYGPKTDRAVLERMHHALRSHQTLREELVKYRKDGTQFVVELSIVPIADAEGRYTHWFSIQRDMTEHVKLRRELRTNDILLRTLTESMPHLLWTADADGRREWVSERFVEFVGAERKDCLGDGWVRFVHPDDRETALQRLQADRQRRRISTSELRLRHRDGEYVWFMKQATPRFAADGSVSKWIGSFTDISGRKSAETALRDSEERLRLGMTVAKLAIAEIDYATGLSHLSAEASALYGLGSEPRSVKREVVHATFHPSDLQEVQHRIAACRDPRGPGWFEMDHRVVWPGGEVRWLRVRKQVFFEGEGSARKPVRAMLAAFDISESRQSEESVRLSERRFRDLAESMPQFVWVADAKGRKTYCNQRYLDYTGVQTCELIDMQWNSFVHPEEREAASLAWKKALETQTPYLQEYRLRRHDGEFRAFVARAIPVRNESGGIDRWLGSTTDIHERKLAEYTLRRTEKLAVVSRMASSISHGINNPLAGAVNLLYLLETDADLSPAARRLVESAQEQLRRVTEVTKQTLLFHRQSSPATEISLPETIDMLLALHRQALETKTAQLLRRDRPTQALLCRSGEIQQALAHVLSNAVEALRTRGILSVRVREWTLHRIPEAPPERGIRITIGDSGTGIQQDDLPKIFNAFFTTKGQHGTGLGLWISRDILERHHGAIRVKSSTRKGASGTVFQIFLPYESVPDISAQARRLFTEA